jgi:hypothetical protein
MYMASKVPLGEHNTHFDRVTGTTQGNDCWCPTALLTWSSTKVEESPYLYHVRVPSAFRIEYRPAVVLRNRTNPPSRRSRMMSFATSTVAFAAVFVLLLAVHGGESGEQPAVTPVH